MIPNLEKRLQKLRKRHGGRILIAIDGDGMWMRRVSLVHQDDIRKEKIYHCDKHLAAGETFETLLIEAESN